MRATFTLAAAAGIVVGLLAAIVVSHQRAVFIIATVDVPVFDVDDPMKRIGTLAKDAISPVLWCEDNKSTIEPVIDVDGRSGRARGPYKIVTERTGIFSRPHFLGCGDL